MDVLSEDGDSYWPVPKFPSFSEIGYLGVWSASEQVGV
jgi:hypothetical protein